MSKKLSKRFVEKIRKLNLSKNLSKNSSKKSSKHSSKILLKKSSIKSSKKFAKRLNLVYMYHRKCESVQEADLDYALERRIRICEKPKRPARRKRTCAEGRAYFDFFQHFY